MRNSLVDVVDAAMRVLDGGGLESCSMRRIAKELDVQVSALYHHVPNKQSLLGLMADRILGGVGGDTPREICWSLRDAMLGTTDGADVVATANAFRLSGTDIELTLDGMVGRDGATTLLLFTFGHTHSTQMHAQATAAGAVTEKVEWLGSFERGLEIILAGLGETGVQRAAFSLSVEGRAQRTVAQEESWPMSQNISSRP